VALDMATKEGFINLFFSLLKFILFIIK